MPAPLALPHRVAGPALLPLRRALREAVRSGGDLVVQCSDVQELSPAGQALLVATSRAARRRGHRLRLVHPSPAVLGALGATGLLHLLSSGPLPGEQDGRLLPASRSRPVSSAPSPPRGAGRASRGPGRARAVPADPPA